MNIKCKKKHVQGIILMVWGNVPYYKWDNKVDWIRCILRIIH